MNGHRYINYNYIRFHYIHTYAEISCTFRILQRFDIKHTANMQNKVMKKCKKITKEGLGVNTNNTRQMKVILCMTQILVSEWFLYHYWGLFIHLLEPAESENIVIMFCEVLFYIIRFCSVTSSSDSIILIHISFGRMGHVFQVTKLRNNDACVYYSDC